jgi:aryl-phospho-beta-D-glucosidase BglC (GH1 family)
MQKKIFLVLAVYLIAATALNAQHKYFHTNGKEIVGPDDKPVLLKGINTGTWLVPEGYMFKFNRTSSPRLIYQMVNELIGNTEAVDFWNKFRDNYITKEDIQFIKSCGFNSVRIPFHYQFFVSVDYPELEINAGMELLKKAVKWCAEEKLYVILDMHCAPGGQTGDNIDDSFGYPGLFESEYAQRLTIKVWEKIAKEFADNEYVIGYDLLNEPIAHYFKVDEINPKLEPFYKRLITALRAIDKNHIMFIGGAQWDSNFRIFGEPFDGNSVYTFHKYWSPTDKSVIQEYIDFRDKHNVPIWLGESGENTNEWISAFRKTLEENNIGWCFWTFKRLDATRCVASVKPPESYDTLIAYSECNRAGYEDIRKNRPDAKLIKKVLEQYLENIRFKNCVINKEYLEALGVNSGPFKP